MGLSISRNRATLVGRPGGAAPEFALAFHLRVKWRAPFTLAVLSRNSGSDAIRIAFRLFRGDSCYHHRSVRLKTGSQGKRESEKRAAAAARLRGRFGATAKP
jgi:hypothetical protein